MHHPRLALGAPPPRPPIPQSAAPSVGIGRIKARDNPALYGTDREHTQRTPDDPFYKRFSAEASRCACCCCCCCCCNETIER